MDKQDIQTIRLKLGLTQRDFADKLGVSQKTIWFWESGKSEPNTEYEEKLTTLYQEVVKEGSQGSQNESEVVKTGSQNSEKVVNFDDTGSQEVVKNDNEGSQEVVKNNNGGSQGSQEGSQNFEKVVNFDDEGSQEVVNIVKIENIPLELKEYPHWLCWGVELRDGKETKIPYSPHGGRAKSDDSSTWGTFEQAQAYLEKNPNLSGLGFVFADDDPFCGIDLDKCRDPQTGVVDTDAQKIISDFGSYTEISPSGKGVHIILKGKKMGEKCRSGKIEIYDTERYFTFTGSVLNEHRTIELRQEQLDLLYNSLFAKEEKQGATKQPQTVSLDDQALIEKAKSAKDGAKFTALWEGDISGYDSHSEADLALCCLLVFWTGGDRHRIDALFRQSGLYREKWEREDYRESTINNAIESTTEFFEPNGNNLFQKKKTKEDFCPYFKKDTFIPKLLADDILSDNRFINVKGLLYRYQNGVYIDDGEQFIEAESQNKLGNESRLNRINETIYYIKVDSYTEPERVNPTDKGHLINVQNGLYDWIEGKLLPHDPNHFSTIQIPVEYDPQEKCQTVDYFLNSTLPADCVPIAEELFGYALIPYVRFEKAFMFTGNGANGKSTFLTLLEKFVGSRNVSKVPLQDLDEHRFKRAELFGKLLNLFADLDARDLQSSTYFKTIVSGDAIDAERKFQDPFFFRPFARMAFSANEIPKSPDNSYAYFRRWCIIPFPKRFEGKDADKSLADKMTEPSELSGLLNRALKGLHRLFTNEGFTESATIQASLDDYRKQNDTVTAFVLDCCEFNPEAEIKRTELYVAYAKYCEDGNYDPTTRNKCYDRLRMYPQVGEKKKDGIDYFTGIGKNLKWKSGM